MELSKQSAAEDEEKRKKEAAAAGTPSESSKENGNLDKDKAFGGLGSLSRSHRGSKSMSKKSFGFLGNKNGDGKSTDDSSHTAVEGEAGPQTPEKHSKSTKDRFSFSGLGRKKSNLMNS
jgi:ubiquitin carboxyl-terminal hydrolase 9/13